MFETGGNEGRAAQGANAGGKIWMLMLRKMMKPALSTIDAAHDELAPLPGSRLATFALVEVA